MRSTANLRLLASSHNHRLSRTEIEQLSEIRSQRDRDHHLSDTKVHKVDDKHRDSGDGGDEHLVPPSDVEQVIANTQ